MARKKWSPIERAFIKGGGGDLRNIKHPLSPRVQLRALKRASKKLWGEKQSWFF